MLKLGSPIYFLLLQDYPSGACIHFQMFVIILASSVFQYCSVDESLQHVTWYSCINAWQIIYATANWDGFKAIVVLLFALQTS